MTEENKVWVILWGYWDGSDSGVVNNMAYKDWQAAQHIKATLDSQDPTKKYTLLEVGVVQGELR
jgi:hypothetical protein